MKSKVLLIWLLLASVLQAAITEKYVSSAGAGAHDGTSEANAFTFAEMRTDINAGSKAGNRYNLIGSFSLGTDATAISGSGSSTSPIVLRGYATTITDGYQGRTNNHGSLITTNFAALTYTTTGRLNLTGSWINLECLNVSSAASAAAVTGSPTGAVTRCKIANSSTNSVAQGVLCGNGGVVINNDVALTGGSGGQCAIALGPNGRALANRVTGGPAIGIMIANTPGTAIDNLVYTSGGVGIAVSATGSSGLIYGNTIVGGSGDGIDVVTGNIHLQVIANNLITDNTGYGIDGVSAANAIFATHNRTRDNAGHDNSATDWLAATKFEHVTTDQGTSSDEYTSIGTGDYSLLPGSPAKGVGHFKFRDIGALQRQEASGGVSRSRVVNP